MFLIVTGGLIYSYRKELDRKECREDKDYNEMVQISVMIVMVTGIIGIFMACSLIFTIWSSVNRCKIKQENPEYLSSDEEDDREYLSDFRVSR